MNLVLIAGLLSNEILWKHQVDHLSDIANIYVVSPNQDTPDKMVKEVLDAAPEKFALAGHSMGGWLCLEVMRKAPSRVSRLSLLNTSARSDTSEKAEMRRKMISRVKSGQFEEVVDEIAAYFVFNSHFVEKVKEMFLEVGSDAFVRQEEAMLNRKECLSILPTITCPTLVIHAAEDKNFSFEEHREMTASLKNAKLEVIEGSGHMSPLEKPEAVTSLLRTWLTL